MKELISGPLLGANRMFATGGAERRQGAWVFPVSLTQGGCDGVADSQVGASISPDLRGKYS